MSFYSCSRKNRFNSLLPSFAALLLVIGFSAAQVFAQTDIALNKTATSSSNENPTNVPGNAVDGNSSTRWSSLYSDPQWLQVDLGATYSVTRVTLVWEAASAKDYQVQMSADGSTWTSIATRTNMANGARTDDITGLSGSGRYIRMNGTARTTTWGYSLFTFSVYGTTGTTYTLTVQNDGHGTTTPSGNVTVTSGVAQSISATPSSGYAFSNWTVTSGTASIANANSAGTTVTLSSGNATIQANFAVNNDIALNKTATSSSNQNTSSTASNAVDGNSSTRWESQWSDPQWIRIDLGATYSVNRVVLVWEAASAKDYQVQMSADGTNWTTTLATKTNMANGARTDDLTGLSGSGRYIRMNGTARTTTYGYSLFTFSVYGTTSTTYTLTVTNDGHGTTTPSGNVTVTSGVAQSISATASSGYTFSNWTVTAGTASIANANSASTTVTLSSGNATIQANFTASPVTYTLTVQNDGHGTTTPSGNVTVTSGVAQSISATASSGYTFSNWTVTSGSASIANANSANTTVTLSSGNATIQANFTASPVYYTLTVTNDGHGSTTPSGNVTVTSGVAQSISATANSGYTFSNWTVTSGSASIANANSANTTVTLSSGNATVRANFVVSGNPTMAWAGTMTSTPSSPYTGLAYRNSSSNKSHIYYNSAWETIADAVTPGTTYGDMQYWNGTQWVLIPAGGSNQVLTVTGINQPPQWRKRPMGSVVDIDGNVYQTIVIGNQEWTVTNLKTTRLNDGTAIPNVTDAAAWSALTTPGSCFLYNDISYKEKYGALYNWHAVNTGMLAPTGWRVPTITDWETLRDYLIAHGYNYDGTTTGNKIAKAMVTGVWRSSGVAGQAGNDLNSNNRSGFSAVPGGLRYDNGSFFPENEGTRFWSTTQSNATEALDVLFSWNEERLFGPVGDKKTYGLAIRLVRDLN